MLLKERKRRGRETGWRGRKVCIGNSTFEDKTGLYHLSLVQLLEQVGTMVYYIVEYWGMPLKEPRMPPNFKQEKTTNTVIVCNT